MTLLRSVAYLVWLYGSMVVLAILYAPAFVVPGRGWLMHGIRLWTGGAVWGLRAIAGARTEVRGLDRLPADAVLIAAKHQGMFDTVAPFTHLPDPALVMKRELLALPIFGWAARKSEMIAIDREGHAAALRRLVQDARDRLAEGRHVIIFPEGTRQAPGAAPDYKPGVAGLYRELGVTCVPMATNSGLFWPAHGVLRRPGTVVFEYLEPIPPGLKRGEFMRVLQERIETASDALLREARGRQETTHG